MSAVEATEQALFQKLDSFSKTTAQDNIKIREIGDILMEMNAAKADEYLQGEAYLNTAHIINPVVEKLPHSLQENWISQGAKFLTPEALPHVHLKALGAHIPKLEPDAQILLLIGRDLVKVHKVKSQINGPHNSLFAQKLNLGWVQIGEVCRGNVRRPKINTYKTCMHAASRKGVMVGSHHVGASN